MQSFQLNRSNSLQTAWWLRATSAFLVFTLLWPSYAAASSTLLQSPPFTPIEPPANVMLMLDDSGSMSEHRLPTPPDVTLSTSSDPRLCNVSVPGYTTVESCGNTKLLRDSSNRYWVQEGNAMPVPLISDPGSGRQHVSNAHIANFYGRWEPLAAETINNQNRILWRNITGNFLHYWNVSSNWIWLSSVGEYYIGSPEWKTMELDFWFDHNNDGKFGDSPVQWYNRVAISGYGGDEAGNWAIRTFAVSRDDDWILRSPALNPLWYNPAVWYKPWNNNNQTGSGAFPNANIGGSVAGANQGAVTSRPNNSLLTQRDMRRVPTGSGTYTSVTPLAGSGTIGGWTNYPDPSGSANGRTVTGALGSTTVRYSYAGMPLEHGATSVSNSQTIASDAAPLDLFMRPVRTVNTTSVVWRRRASCNDATLATFLDNPGNLACFKQTNCDGTVVYSATAQAAVTCYTRRTSCTDSTPRTSTDSSALSCFQRLTCDGSVNEITPNDRGALYCWTQRNTCSDATTVFRSSSSASPSPPPLICGWSRRASCTNGSTIFAATAAELPPLYCRQNCANTATETVSSDQPLTCYERSESCTNTTAKQWSTNATDLPTLYCRRDCPGNLVQSTTPLSALNCQQREISCTNTTKQGYDPNSTILPTLYCRQKCDTTWEEVTSSAGPLPCWTRIAACGSSTVGRYSSDPGTMYCRQDCDGTWRATLAPAPQPPALSCWRREGSCDNTSLQYWTQVSSPGSLSCPRIGELPIVYDPVPYTQNTQTHLSSGGTNPVTSYAPTSLQRSVTELPVLSFTRSVTTYSAGAPVTYDAVPATNRASSAITYSANPDTRNSLPETFAAFTENTTGTTITGPHVERLTPARYYYWNGSTANGGKGNPANYVLVQIDRTRPTTGGDDLTRYVIRDATTGATVSSPRCAALTWCTWQEEAQNFANWYTYYRNRMFSAIAVMAESLSLMQEDKFQNLRIGYGRINYFAGAYNPWNTNSTFSSIDNIDGATNPGGLVRGVRPFIVGSAARQQFFDWLFSLAWGGSTPNREAIDAAGRYFTRTDNRGPWGATPGTENAQPQIACRRNFTLLATDGEWTNVSAGQPLISSTGPLADAAGTGNPTASDSVNGPSMTSGIDGTTFTYRPTNYPQFTGGAAQNRTLTDATVYYWNRDLRPDLPNVVKPVTAEGRTNEAFWQSMSTYIVGYGLFASMDTDATRMAIARGTRVNWPEVEGVSADTFNSANAANRVNDSFRAAVASRGQFYTATTTDTLANAVRSTFDELVIQTGSAGGVALPGAVVQDTDMFFRPSYFLGKNTYGKLEAFKVSDMASLATNPDAVTPQWNASIPVSRTILTSTAATTATTFAATNLTSTQQTLIGGGNVSLAGDVVNYLSGSNTKEIANGGTFRNRISPFGTFVNSRPLYSKAPDFGYASLPDIGSAYRRFVENNKTGRTAAVYIGGNAGMFHAFRADNGVELFAYVPRGVYDNLYSLTVPSVAHRYFVDGPVVQGDAYLGSAWKNIIVGTTGAGGASVFALDVTNPGAMDATKVLFDVTKADSEYLGHILGTGVLGRIKTGTDTYEWVYIVGNGVESSSQQAALLVIGLEGSNKGVVRAIPVGALWDNTVANRNGMGGINVVYGAQRSIVAVFGGDRLGNMWRFDFSQGIPKTASGFAGDNQPLFTAKDSSNNPQAITIAPILYPHANNQWYVVFGTGKLYDSTDPTDTQVQTLYGLLYNGSETSVIQRSNLNPVTPSVAGAFSATPSDTKKRGWYLDLEAAERVIGNPTIGNSLIRISTYKPSSSTNVCLSGGTSRLFSIDVLSSAGTVAETTATVANPVPHFKPRAYGSPAASPTRQQVQKSLRGKASSAESTQCRVTTVGVDKTVGGTGQSTRCPQTPVLRTWRNLAR